MSNSFIFYFLNIDLNALIQTTLIKKFHQISKNRLQTFTNNRKTFHRHLPLQIRDKCHAGGDPHTLNHPPDPHGNSPKHGQKFNTH